MSKIILKKNGTDYLFGLIPLHYPADRVYLDGDTTKNVQDKVARKSDLTNLDIKGTTNATGSTISSGTYFYLNEVLVRAKTDIASGATFTLNTNYEVVTAGGLNEIVKRNSLTLTPVSTSEYSLSEYSIQEINGVVIATLTIRLEANSQASGEEYTWGINGVTPQFQVKASSYMGANYPVLVRWDGNKLYILNAGSSSWSSGYSFTATFVFVKK